MIQQSNDQKKITGTGVRTPVSEAQQVILKAQYAKPLHHTGLMWLGLVSLIDVKASAGMLLLEMQVAVLRFQQFMPNPREQLSLVASISFPRLAILMAQPAELDGNGNNDGCDLRDLICEKDLQCLNYDQQRIL